MRFLGFLLLAASGLILSGTAWAAEARDVFDSLHGNAYTKVTATPGKVDGIAPAKRPLDAAAALGRAAAIREKPCQAVKGPGKADAGEVFIGSVLVAVAHVASGATTEGMSLLVGLGLQGVVPLAVAAGGPGAEQPGLGVERNRPGRAGEPEGPRRPGEREEPRRSGEPEGPRRPREREEPRRSGEPEDPRRPGEREEPRRSGEPEGPRRPGEREEPRRSGEPEDPRRPREREEPRRSGEPEDPRRPREREEARRSRERDEGSRRRRRERFLDDVQARIGATDEEWKVIGPKLRNLVSTRQTVESGEGPDFGGPPPGSPEGPGSAGARVTDIGPLIQARADLQAALAERATSDDAIRERLAVLREARRKVRVELAAATKDLLRLLTLEQEARLVSLGYVE